MNDYILMHSAYLAHFKTKGAKNGIRRYQSYAVAPNPSGAEGQEIGEAAEQRARITSKQDNKDFRQARREVSAATRNAKRIATGADAASANLKDATDAYNKELGKFRVSRKKKAENLKGLDENLTVAKEQYKNATDEYRRAKDVLSDAAKRYTDLAKKTGRDIKPKTIDAGRRTLGMVLGGKNTEFKLDTYRTGLTGYDTTMIGRALGRRYVNKEMDRRRRAQ